MEFISVLELVDSVAKHVSIPVGWKDGVLKREEIPVTPFIDRFGRVHALEGNHNIKIGMLNGLFLMAFRASQAASIIDQHLHNAAEQGPSWFDWGETGRPKLSEAARNDAMPMLVHMSRYFDRYEEFYQTGRFDNWPIANDIPTSEGKFKNGDDFQRLSEIGFERTELMEFLGRCGILHLFCGSPSAEVGATPASQAFSDSNVKPGESAQSTPDALKNSAKDARYEMKVIVHGAKGKRNSLDSAIDRAIERAATYRTPDVLRELKGLALESEPPFNGSFGEQGSLVYTNDENKVGELTKDQLTNRLIRRWRALGHQGPRQ